MEIIDGDHRRTWKVIADPDRLTSGRHVAGQRAFRRQKREARCAGQAQCQILAELDSTELKSRTAAAQSARSRSERDLVRARADLLKAEANLSLARSNHARNEKVQGNGQLDSQQRDAGSFPSGIGFLGEFGCVLHLWSTTVWRQIAPARVPRLMQYFLRERTSKWEF
jgi:hypothetical protein